MSEGLVQNFEYIAAHIKDYIDEDKLFSTFETDDIKEILKYATLNANDFNTLMKQSHSTIKANKLYVCARDTKVSIQNYEDVVSVLKSVKKYMKIRILNGVINFLKQTQKENSDSAAKIQQLQTELSTVQNQKQKSDQELESLKTQLNQTKEDNTRLKKDLQDIETKFNQITKQINQMPQQTNQINQQTNQMPQQTNQMPQQTNQDAEILKKIMEFKNSDKFYDIYKFFDELSSQGNQKMILKAYQEGLWKKTSPKLGKFDDENNIFHYASESGNLRLVKYLIQCGCDKEIKSKWQFTPLIYASREGRLDVVKYLISIGANKDAKDYEGKTSLIWATIFNRLEVVKYLLSIGVNKNAKDSKGLTSLLWACNHGSLEVVKCLIAAGVEMNSKNAYGWTPLSVAQEKGHPEVVKYLRGK
ncbi:hypothetical protein TVAG_360890 [Trichomonas vaginalis G3]|uniref:Uncharacterized protein n=1 Tax=Trichomonas vaginalis (strain ATCC PRA-98 / G3) TaxID=412133 RepID=A2FGP6_TRIV3|nr:ankyrin repeats (many copies)-containing protein [Trichomonas vaginalis G3]EAX95928.1 hypothetical protein TVAG_360890 [Trichomonas vaginalis G3]KAI5540142.1 ankyrin repeats (many copies)-containing protein [Trichomonas vaginalis G3]|eukprot:XP_001308858.1 hypothetical protein [Trichomonas vaginalis G3]